MSGHTPWRKIKHKRARSAESPVLDHWLNLVADVEVSESVVDEFVDELVDRLPGASVGVEQAGTLRQLDITVEATITRDEFASMLGGIANKVGADLVRARIADEYAWQRD